MPKATRLGDTGHRGGGWPATSRAAQGSKSGSPTARTLSRGPAPGAPPAGRGAVGRVSQSCPHRLCCARVAAGMLSYCDRYGEGMTRILRTFGPVPAFSGATAEQVHQVRGSARPGGRSGHRGRPRSLGAQALSWCSASAGRCWGSCGAGADRDTSSEEGLGSEACPHPLPLCSVSRLCAPRSQTTPSTWPPGGSGGTSASEDSSS